MNNRIQYILIVALLAVLSTTSGRAQHLARDLECMHSAYLNLDKYYTEVRVDIYARGSTTPAMTQKGVVRKDGNAFLYDFEGTLMLYNEAVILILDSRQKQALLGARTDDPDLGEMLSQQSADMDSLLRGCDSVAYRGMEKGLRHYTVYTSRQTIQRTDLWIHDGTSLLARMEYLYDRRLYPDLNRVEVRFDNQDTSPSFSRQLFSERRFLKGSPGSYQLKPPYESYELIVSQTEEN